MLLAIIGTTQNILEGKHWMENERTNGDAKKWGQRQIQRYRSYVPPPSLN